MTNHTGRRIFVDLDGVVVDFDHYARTHGLTPDDIKRRPGAYRAMAPMPGALAGLRELARRGFEVWLASKPATGQAHTYADKVGWVLDHAAWLQRRIILTHDKGLLGDARDLLIDDRPHRANCVAFPGTLLHFGQPPFPDWAAVLAQLQVMPPHRLAPA